MRPIPGFVALLLCSTLSFAVSGASLPGRVLRIIDGDSLVLDVRGAQYQVDLSDIDAPESNQPWGPQASEHLRQMLAGAFVVVDVTDSAGNHVSGYIRVRGRDVALDLLAAGLAWSTVPPDEAQLRIPAAGAEVGLLPTHPFAEAEATARAQHLGLWSDAHPVPPWEWRQQRGGAIR